MTAFTSKLRNNPCYPANSCDLMASLTKYYKSPKSQELVSGKATSKKN